MSAMVSGVSFRVGVDIGGTFTDIVLLGSDGTIHTKKISSSTGDYAAAIVAASPRYSRRPGSTGRPSPKSATARPSRRTPFSRARARASG